MIAGRTNRHPSPTGPPPLLGSEQGALVCGLAERTAFIQWERLPVGPFRQSADRDIQPLSDHEDTVGERNTERLLFEVSIPLLFPAAV